MPENSPEGIGGAAAGASRGPLFGYGGLMLITTILILIALFVPGWRMFPNDGPQLGLVTYHCGSGSRQVPPADCTAWYNDRRPFERATLAFMILAAATGLLSLVLFGLLFKSPKASLAGVAAATAFLTFVFLLVAVLVYGIAFKSKPVYMNSQSNEMNGNSFLGYAYWLAVAALVLSLLPIGAAAAARAKIVAYS